jgi:hypothetical protein
LPLAYTRWVFRQFEDSYRERVVVYFHPWEIDPTQPRIHDKLKSRLRHYSGLNKTMSKLEFLLSRYRFDTLIGISRTEESLVPVAAASL